MIPPVVASTPTYRNAAPADAAVRSDEGRDPAQAPARAIRSELPTAVEAARRAATLQKLRDEDRLADGAAGAAPAGLDPPPDAPTGPPPTFDETPLERQVRTAFDPPDPPPAVDERSSSDAPGETTEGAEPGDGLGPATPAPPAAWPALADSVPQGFREVASDFSRSTPSKVDAKA